MKSSLLSNSKHVAGQKLWLDVWNRTRKNQGKAGVRAYDCFKKCLESVSLFNAGGYNIALTPPLITDEKNIDLIMDTVHDALKSI